MSKVWFYPLPDNPSLEQQMEAVRQLQKSSDMMRIIAKDDFVAIKVHVGEKNNTTHVKPELIKEVVSACHFKTSHVFLTETSTLYRGERDNAVSHIMHAHRHGFSIERVGAPFIMADGLMGSAEVEVTVNGEYEKTVRIAREIAYADILIAVSHPTGHLLTGLAACIKNLGMGLASRAGKMRQHSSIMPEVKANRCQRCGKCIRWCPENAILERDSDVLILSDECAGCGECMTVCRHDAIAWNFQADSSTVQKRMAEYAWGVIREKKDKCFYLNVLVGMTADCDCFGTNQKKIMPDLGIMASFDPVALDKATLDLTAEVHGKSLPAVSHKHLDPGVQLAHAAALGMGQLEYERITIR